MKGAPGPRQPLSQRRPSKAVEAHAAKLGAAAARPPVPRGRKAAATIPPPARPRGRESAAARAARAAEIYDRLQATYPDAHCELDHRNAFELLVATILSAQCTDKRVNMVTPALFARYPDAESLAAARQEDVEELVKSTGFYRSKAKNLIAMATAVVERHGGEVPADMAALTALPGVGRKTANVILGNAFGVNEGVVVDTHVQRLAGRLGFTRETDPVKIEQELMRLFPRERWTMLSHLLIFHGRRTCVARNPKCGECPVAGLCPSAQI